MVYRYPQEVHDFVKANVQKMWDTELAEECNRLLGTHFTKNSMKAFRSNFKYLNGRPTGYTHEDFWKHQTKYPKGMYEYIKENSWGAPSKDLAEMVNTKFGTAFTPAQMKAFRQRNGIKSGLTGWYQKEHTPGNKGKKITDYVHDPETLERIRATQFEKGRHPENEHPVGTIVVDADGYKLRKKQMDGNQWDRWEMLHRAVWIEHNGPIPEGYVVSFRDNNRLNCDISNLMLITRQENQLMNRHKLRSGNPELTDAGLLVARVEIACSKKRNKE